MDQKRFTDARNAVLSAERERNGIGTLGEKTLHAVLKAYCEPSADSREIKIGRYVADIVGENGIIEIQTRDFNHLRKKLEAFLPCAGVTVVYPVAQVKYLCWINEETGEVSEKRKSPKIGKPVDAFPELYKIKPLLTDPHLSFHLLLLEVTEYRYLNGWSKDKKKGSSRCDRIPERLLGEVTLDCPADYAVFLPDALPVPFTSKDYAKAIKRNSHLAQTGLNVLYEVGAVKRVGKTGNLYLYEITP